MLPLLVYGFYNKRSSNFSFSPKSIATRVVHLMLMVPEFILSSLKVYVSYFHIITVPLLHLYDLISKPDHDSGLETWLGPSHHRFALRITLMTSSQMNHSIRALIK